jgi:KDO2-lipid IV(A) lauroyltransferase
MADAAAPPLRLRIKRLRRRLMFLGLRTLLRTAGPSRAGAIGRVFGELEYRLGGRARRRIQADMAVALGRPPGERDAAALLREAYRSSDGAVLEIMALMDRRIEPEAVAAACTLSGLEHLRAATAQGRGAILLAAHMGNAALVAVKLAQDGWPVSVVYRRARMMSEDFFQNGLEQYGVQGILANAGIQAYGQMLKALRQGRVVFMMLDQGVRDAETGLVRRFLGKDMPMPAGPAQLARAARAPVLPVATTASRPRWTFDIEPAVPLGADTLDADLTALVQATERQVLQHPELWSWHHRRWRQYPIAGTAA